MTIKQQGGIFGRNPTFKNVEIEGDLTVEGSTTKNGDEVINGRLDISGTNPFLYIMETDQADDNTYIRQAGGNFQIGQVSDDKGTRKTRLWIDQSSGDIKFYNVAGDTAKLTYNSTTGNLQMADGAGIDFSATSGTGTSELFDDYEEGTWTPTYVPASGAFGSITYDTAITGGKYTKVGNLVHIQGGIRTDAITVGTASGGIRLGGLPFTAIASGTGQDGWSTLTVGQVAAFAGDVPSTGSVVAGQSYIELQYRSAANGATIDLAVADLDTGADDNLMRFAATYIAG